MKIFFLVAAVTLICILSCCERTMDIEIDPENPEEEIDISACVTSVSSEVFEIMTWNVKQFPIDNERTVKALAQIIEEQSPDLVAFQ